MTDEPSGAEVAWDYQLGTFTGALGALRVGRFGGDIVTVGALEQRLGVALSAETGAALQQDYLAAPYLAARRYVSKLEFMDLFSPASLQAIYTAARVDVAVQIELDRVDRAADNRIELTSPRTRAGLQQMEAAHLIDAGDAERISKGIPWQP
jgi:hypothetical protein